MTKLRRVMQEKGYNGRTFSEACGVGHSIIYKYMCGSRKLSYKIAKRFAVILGVKPEDLLED
ncbi:MAG: helix-turn-helix transcriptional regulator [Clostridia bacterium]|nr:helix-turn-helix transcriptional regulator [Clostridia bacterium]